MRVAGGAHAVDEMKRLVDRMCKVGHAATAIPPAALRGGDRLGTLRVMTRYMLRTDVWKSLRYVGELSKPFSEILDEVVTDGFARDFVNLLCFLLAGVTAERIPTAEIAFMFREWTGDAEVETGVLQRPRGGASGLANGLMGVIEREGGVVRTGAEVDHVIVEDGCAKGVVLRSGEALFARRAVISNVSALDVRKLLPGWKGEDEKGEMCESFMHLHMAIRLSDEVMRHVAESGLQANYVVVDDWALGVERAGNVVLVSMPSVIDESVCPAGYAVLHAYTPATEPYSLWEGVKRGSAQYKKLKRERARPLWKAVGKIFGRDMEGRGEVEFCSVGSPLTHARYLRRARGSYGPKVDARRGLGLGLPFPGQGDWPRGFWCVGDGVFPGVGVPGVAGSAWIVANGCVDVEDQVRMLDDIGL